VTTPTGTPDHALGGVTTVRNALTIP